MVLRSGATMHIRELINQRTILLDGAMGTYFSEKYEDYTAPCELANIEKPEYVYQIHKEYIEAGADALRTNTFSVNPLNDAFSGDRLEETIRAGVEIARKAAGDADRDVAVFADLGPVVGSEPEQSAELLIRMCDLFLDQGVSNFIFETNSNFHGIREAAEYIRRTVDEAFIIVSFSVQPDGYTREGFHYLDLFEQAEAAEAVDVYGLNCILSALHMHELTGKVDLRGKKICVMPNGGYPRVAGRRIYYDSDPAFFCDQVELMIHEGIAVAGGCCGTRPEFIRQLSERLDSSRNTRRTPLVRPVENGRKVHKEENRFWSKLASGKKVIAVELDTPGDADGNQFMSGAWQLKSAGVDAITVADCPTARARMDSCLMACKIKRELDMDPIPHMTCRDRNLNATKALLLGISMEGIRNVLLVTGDPIPSAERDEVKSVYQFNSRMLSGFVKSLNTLELEHPFRIYGALNVNARHFETQLRLAEKKMENGVSCFLTQPVLTENALKNLRLAHETLGARILGGIIPVVSSRNGRFMNSEIAGITVDEAVVELYEGKSREECTDLAVTISVDFARRMEPYVDGYYLVTPFSRVDIITRIVRQIRGEEA